MKLIHPVTEGKKAELQKELEFQRERFLKATRTSSDKLKDDLSLVEWMREFPLQGAMVAAATGFMVSQWLRSSRSLPKKSG